MKKVFKKIFNSIYETPDLLLGLFFVIGVPILWWFEFQEFIIGFIILLIFLGVFTKGVVSSDEK